MHKERLKEAIKCLEDVIERDKKFDMRDWIDEISFDDEMGELIPPSSDVIAEYPAVKDFCNTACCAFGHMAFWPPFREQGLKIKYNHRPYVAYEKYHGDNAAKLFFGLTEGQTIDLFFPSRYPDRNKITPQDVIKKIEGLLSQQ